VLSLNAAVGRERGGGVATSAFACESWCKFAEAASASKPALAAPAVPTPSVAATIPMITAGASRAGVTGPSRSERLRIGRSYQR